MGLTGVFSEQTPGFGQRRLQLEGNIFQNFLDKCGRQQVQKINTPVVKRLL